MSAFRTRARRAAVALAFLAASLTPAIVAAQAPAAAGNRDLSSVDVGAELDLGLLGASPRRRHYPHAVWLLAVEPVQTGTPAPGALTRPLLVPEPGVDVDPQWRVSLTCEPTLGTHPHQRAACRTLMAADGDIGQIPPDQDATCTDDYKPHRFRAEGLHGGTPRSYDEVFPNLCTGVAATGVVFDLD